MIQAPKKSGSLFNNFKCTFSVVLLAVVDAKYCFDVGSYGRTSDDGTLANSTFGHALIEGTLQLPEDTLLPEWSNKSLSLLQGPQVGLFQVPASL